MSSLPKIIAAAEGRDGVLMSDISSCTLEYWLPRVERNDPELYCAIKDELEERAR